MDWGMRNRLSQIIRPEDGRTVMLAVDHGYFLGPTSHLEDPRKTIAPLLEFADALMVTRGVLRNCVDPKTSTPVVLRVSGGPSVIGEDLANEDLTTSIEDAVRINASAVTMSVFIGSKYEKQTVANLAKLVDQGEAHGIPVLAVTAVGKEMARDARYLGLACRISAETGAHFVKTYYCDEFAKVVEGCPVPLVIAGGKQMKSELDVFALAHNALAEGAVGVDFGRNVWQNPRPVPMIKAIRAIVHEKHTPKEALELYNSKK